MVGREWAKEGVKAGVEEVIKVEAGERIKEIMMW